MRAVIFDMDGVIIDSEPMHIQLEQTMFEELGINIGQKEHESFLGTNGHEMFESLKETYDLTRSVDDLVKDERARYLSVLKNGPLPLIDGIPELVMKLKAGGYSLAVASSAPHEQIDLVLERSELEQYFDARVSGDDVELSKPHPAVFLKAAGELRIPAVETWVIEDSRNGIIAANEAGMRSIAFVNPSSGEPDLSGADYLVHSISEAGAIIL